MLGMENATRNQFLIFFPVLFSELESEDVINEARMESDDPKRFEEERDGYHLITPFQCDLYHFDNYNGRLSIKANEKDDVLLLYIRRAILDSLWYQERSTLVANQRQGKLYLSAGATCGWDGEKTHPDQGPFPKSDV